MEYTFLALFCNKQSVKPPVDDPTSAQIFPLRFSNLKLIPHYVFSEMGWLTGFLGIIGLVILLKNDLRAKINDF